MNGAAQATWDEEVAGHPFLRGLNPDFLRRIRDGTTPRTYATDEFLLHEGEPARHLFLILSGKVALELAPGDRPSLTIETVGAGQVVGWSWCIDSQRYEHDARALKPTRAVAIDAPTLRAACEEDPVSGYALVGRLLTVVADRLANTRLQLLNSHCG